MEGGEGNQSCKIAKCSLQHGKVEYCNQCPDFPCEQYDGIDEFDSFVTHRNQIKDLERAGRLGSEAYHSEQLEKRKILDYLLENYNDGRKKTLFCLAVNLLELTDLKIALCEMESNKELKCLPLKERAANFAKRFHEIAGQRQIILRLRKK